jgi:hypothetical protein
MSDKTYWAYQGYPCELVQTGVCKHSGIKEYKNKYPPAISMTLHTYLFDTQDEAYACAEENGEFEQCHGKEDWCEIYDEALFEVSEKELKDYIPFVLPHQEIAA